MFWRVSGLNTTCPVDAILDKDEYTLEELLNEDELIQECKSLNPRLTEFLKKKENVEKLVEFLVVMPDENADDTRQFKYPFTACEIFCCEVESIYNTLLENDDIMDKLFGILESPRPLNTIRAGYFSRVMGSLLARRSGDVVQYLRKQPTILNSLVHHVDTTSMAEVLARLAGADEPQGYEESPSVQWLAETDVLDLLVASLGSDMPLEGQANAAEVLAAIARSTTTQLTQSMASADFMQKLVDSALAPHSGLAAAHAVNVCLALLEPIGNDPTMGPAVSSEMHENLRKQAIGCLASGVDRLVAMMDPPSEGQVVDELKTTYGMIKPPVGQLRLKIVDLLASLLRTNDPVAEKAIMGTQAVQHAMKMFLDYPFNNALHGGVMMLLTALEEGSLELRKFFMEQVCLVDWLIDAPTEIQPSKEDAPSNEPTVTERKPMRAGYCGHVTQICNVLVKTSNNCAFTRDFLANHPRWSEYQKTVLEPRNLTESVFSWKCGRPAAQSMGIYSSDVTFTSMDNAFDSEHNTFGALDEDVGDPSVPEWGMGPQASDPKNLEEAVGEWDDSDSDDSDYDSDEENKLSRTRGALGSEGPDVSSMVDMQDDEVMIAEVEASEGLLALESDLGRLTVNESKDQTETEQSQENGESTDSKPNDSHGGSDSDQICQDKSDGSADA